jgi:DNA polymerase II large subunit
MIVNDVKYFWDSDKYFLDLESGVKKEYDLANKAREKGFDPLEKVEIPLATSMAQKCVGLISTIYEQLPIDEITSRMLELENEYGQLDTTVSFIIAKEIADEKFCKFKDRLEAIDAGIRVGFAYITLGVVASPIEGYTGFEVCKRRDGGEYFKVNFSGPIRSAGTTATCVVLMLIDFLRESFGYGKYDPSEEEIKRYITENNDYHERVTNLQYLPTEEEMEFLAKNLPIEISGDPTEKREVSNYKDLERVSTNFIRGGMCLTFSEGLAQKAAKGLMRLNNAKKNGLVCSGWDFLSEYIDLHSKRTSGKSDGVATYIKDLVAGRPVYGHPGRSGGFRFRYGRSRISGFSSVSIHPATMGISCDFLSHGTQLKIEKPTKGCIVTSCDSIDGPIVKLKSGSVRKIDSLDSARKIYNDVEEIIYLGDILFPLGDVMDRNHDLIYPGYVEEWWDLELKEKLDITGQKIEYDFLDVYIDDAIDFSKKYSIPFYPKFIFYWTEISSEYFWGLIDWISHGVFRGDDDMKLILPWENSVREKFSIGKRALELIGLPHEVVLDNIVIDNINMKALFINLGINYDSNDFVLREAFLKILDKKDSLSSNVLEIVNSLSKFKIKNKAGDFIGSRMGRPEKAKLRKLTGSPNCLFPISDQGGRFRSVNESVRVGYVKYDFPLYKCECGNETIYSLCEKCKKKTKKRYFCKECDKFLDESCSVHESSSFCVSRKIDMPYFFKDAVNNLGYLDYEVPPLIKGVRGLSNDYHDFENLSKGILRAKYNLCVNKDGTIRYDATEVCMTHFKPIEVRTSVEKLRELGYLFDIYGKELVSDDQILELRPHDIVLPACSVTNDERADDVFMNIANFIDEELEKFYGLERFYNIRNREDLVGHLVACMAPHNCAGVIGRIIGFCEIQGLVASPYMHAAMRRDCDGDEAAVMMLLDVLLNFSKKFLPSHRGGTQDAPLVLNAKIQAGEVDDQILNFEVSSSYPLSMYYLAETRAHSSKVKMEMVKDRLKQKTCPFRNMGFTHDCSDFNLGVLNGAYKILPTMKDKVNKQMEIVTKIRAVDTDDVARLIIERHFIRDIRGNLRKFSHQQFRCVACNEKYRRPPLSGVCNKCGGKLIFTISEGSIKKYLEPALELANKYNISEYTKEGMELTKEYIESIFGKETEKQVELKQWF